MGFVGVVAFIVALLISIMLHEGGHLLTAKRYGMKATQYFVGFGPTLWSFRRGETEYGVKAIPAGGFVKIVGMTDLEELDRADDARAFFRQPAGQRAVVLAAGSVTHFLLAIFLLLVVFVGVGQTFASRQINTIAECVTETVTKENRDACKGEPTSPARQATPHDPGELPLQPDDVVVAFNGQPVRDWTTDLADRVRAHPGGPATITVERLTIENIIKRLTYDITVVRVPLKDPVTREVLKDPVTGEVRTRGAVGLVPKPETRRKNPVGAVIETTKTMGALFAGTGKAIVSIPGELPTAIRQTFSGEERKLDTSLTGVVGAGQLAGNAVAAGAIADFLGLMAGLNVFIGVLNLLPLLPLDGGHLAILGFERARSTIAQRIGWRDPGRIDIRKLMPAAYVVIMFFAGLTLLLLYADIVNPVDNPF